MPKPSRLGAVSPAQIAWVSVLSLLLAGGGTAAYLGVNMPATVLPRVTVASVDLGGMTAPQARDAVDAWWQGVAQKPMVARSSELAGQPGSWTPQELGMSIDSEATVAALPKEAYWPRMFREWRGERPPKSEVKPVLLLEKGGLKPVEEAVLKNRKPPQPAKVSFTNGTVSKTPEQAAFSLDTAAAVARWKEAVVEGSDVELPLKASPKKVPDTMLEQIRTVIGQFTTRFDAGNTSRCSNIALAAKMLNGRILMPGETFGFNDTLGQRTKAKGFKEAGVYVSGRHDIDVGGGICQVSTTLYNSVLQAGLKVALRSSHSLPVAYVPLGQDATVSFPEPDFKFVNDRKEPVAITTEYEPGKLTFRLLGATREPGDVSIVNKLVRSWSRGVKYVHDPDLPPGKEVVMEKGGTAREVMSWRVVTLDGKVVKREPLGMSSYTGGPRVVLVNKKAG